MNAKEIDSEEILHKHCNCEFSKQTGEQVVYSTLSSVQMAMESYHKAKSKEEAEKIEKIISVTEDEHPYKEAGNPDSYSSYNEGWTDACDILGERILTIFGKGVEG